MAKFGSKLLQIKPQKLPTALKILAKVVKIRQIWSHQFPPTNVSSQNVFIYFLLHRSVSFQNIRSRKVVHLFSLHLECSKLEQNFASLI